MSNRSGPPRLTASFLTGFVVLCFVVPAKAQFPIPSFGVAAGVGGTFAGQVLDGVEQVPRYEPQGDWGEVIMVNNRWFVLQDSLGRQFPIAFDSVRQFVIRWPTRLDLISNSAFYEVTGIDLGTNNAISTNHIDVYEGTARTLVTPTLVRLVGANRALVPLNLAQQQIYGAFTPLTNPELNLPNRIHVVGPLAARNPLRIDVGGNNAVVVLPSPTGLDMTQITVGTPSYVKKGDLVYFITENAAPKSLILGRMVLYKKVPFQAYNGN